MITAVCVFASLHFAHTVPITEWKNNNNGNRLPIVFITILESGLYCKLLTLHTARVTPVRCHSILAVLCALTYEDVYLRKLREVSQS